MVDPLFFFPFAFTLPGQALTLPIDLLVVDLEDGVAANRKAEARDTVEAALNGGGE